MCEFSARSDGVEWNAIPPAQHARSRMYISTGVKDSGRGCSLSRVGQEALT